MRNMLLKSEKEIIETSINTSKENLDRPFLLEQLKNLKVKKRQYTGVGFYTEFTLDNPNKYYIENYNFIIGSTAEVFGIKYGADFVIYIKNGLIDLLEGVTFGEKWPKTFRIKSY